MRRIVAVVLLGLFGISTAAHGATFTVTNTNASGTGSLAWAIEQANASAGADVIEFNIATTDPNYTEERSGKGVLIAYYWTISLSDLNTLPILFSDLLIDGRSAGASPAGNPTIVLQGSRLVTGSGLVIRGSNVEIRGLSVVGFPGNGILVESTGKAISGNWVYGNWLGVRWNMGIVEDGNGGAGVRIDGTAGEVADSRIGHDVTGEGNIIAGNQGSGVLTTGSQVSGTYIEGNRIGLAGTLKLGNGSHGIELTGVGSTYIGAYATPVDAFVACTGACNIISGNTGNGIYATPALYTYIGSNWIGLNLSGAGPLANGQNGILLVDPIEAFVALNVVSGNTLAGIELTGDASWASINGNHVGTNPDATAAIGNGTDGIRLMHTTHPSGGAPEVASTVVGGNQNFGILVDNADAATIQFISVGTNESRVAVLPNAAGGIKIRDSQDIVVRKGVIKNHPDFAGSVARSQRIRFSELMVDANKYGLLVDQSTDVEIGSATDPTKKNTFQSTLFEAIRVTPTSTDVQIATGNRFVNNGLQINIQYIGFNDPGDADVGANDGQNYPEIVSAVRNEGVGQTLRFRVDSDPAHARYPILVQFYAYYSGNDYVYAGSDVYLESDYPDSKEVTIPFSPSFDPPEAVRWTALATDNQSDPGVTIGNTSNFAPAVASNTLSLATAAWLQGPFDPASGDMASDLQSATLLPVSQPYDGAPWSYAGPEAGGAPTGTVDWVLLELLLGDASATICSAGRRAAFLLNDGQIIDVDGSPHVRFEGLAAASYYVSVRHRNHLGVISSTPVDFTVTGYAAHDFRSSQASAFGGSAMVDLGGGHFGLFAGDADANGQVQNTDKNLSWAQTVGTSGYRAADGSSPDFDLNGQVQNTDKNLLWAPNVGKGAPVPPLCPSPG